MSKIVHGLCALVLAGAGVFGAEAPPEPAAVLLDPCASVRAWSFGNGGEFPGASGQLALDGARGRVALRYDFSGGGEYVAAVSRCPIPETVEKAVFSLYTATPASLALRLTDATGRTFQSARRRVGPGEHRLAAGAADAWPSAWGGKDTAAKKPRAPWKNLAVLVTAERPAENPRQGEIVLLGLHAEGAALAAAPFAAPPLSLRAAGWDVAGHWLPAAAGAVLEVRATPAADAVAAELSFDFPLHGRSEIQRFGLAPGRAAEWRVAFSRAANPRNTYRVEAALRGMDGDVSATRSLPLAGALARPEREGRPRASSEIVRPRFGVCVHYDYAPAPSGPFAGWHPYARLIDDAAECGMKFIRCGARLEDEAGEDGQRRVRARDRAWISYAKEKGIDAIVIIAANAKDSPGEFAAVCARTAADLDGLVEVFELGNEPNNFGGWRKIHSGAWNAKEPDGSVSPWLRAFLLHVNAGAEAIRRVRPDARVIAGGGVPPATVRLLRMGLSPAIDGIVEHPYSMSLPPEQIPYSSGHIERDGVAVGDGDGTLASMIRNLAEHDRESGGGRPRGVWFTEYGFPSHRMSGKNEKGFYIGWSEKAQAVNLLRRGLLTLGLDEVEAACIYDQLDDYNGAPHGAEANFGLLRSDYSRKPAWRVVQRFNALFADALADRSVTATVTDAPLHRGMVRGVVVADWDGAPLSAKNGVAAQPVRRPDVGDESWVAVWSLQPYADTHNNRACTLEIAGAGDVDPAAAMALDLVDGRSFDLPVRIEDGIVRVENLELGPHPLLLRLPRR